MYQTSYSQKATFITWLRFASYMCACAHGKTKNWLLKLYLLNDYEMRPVKANVLSCGTDFKHLIHGTRWSRTIDMLCDVGKCFWIGSKFPVYRSNRTEPEETTKPKHISNDRTRARTPINIIILRVCWRIDLSHKVHQSQNRIINQWLVKWNIYLMSISSPIYWDLIFWQRNRRTDPNRSIGKHQNIINDHQFGTKRSLEALKLH